MKNWKYSSLYRHNMVIIQFLTSIYSTQFDLLILLEDFLNTKCKRFFFLMHQISFFFSFLFCLACSMREKPWPHQSLSVSVGPPAMAALLLSEKLKIHNH